MTTDLQKLIEKRIRIERIKKETRSCKDKLFEVCFNAQKRK